MAEGRVERRLAAILAADVAGYSRLMGNDEEATLLALKACRRELIDPKIAEYRGRIVKTTGDGVLVEFPSAVDAVRCAIEIQRAMAARSTAIPEDRRVEFRIGINVGDIIIDEGDIYGDGVNIAARVEALASPGEICLADNAYQQIKGKLAFDVSDLGEQRLKNIAQPVRVYGVRLDGTPERPALVLPDKPSIAVLPFQNMSGDPEQEYFADGLSEDIITGLSRQRWFFVIARNSSFAFKNEAVDVRRVASELGVRYALEGSVRKAAGRVRVTAQLIDATSGVHLWADRYDRDLADIFDVQDEITNRVIESVGPQIIVAEAARVRRKPPQNMFAWDLVMQALPHLWQMNTEEQRRAQELLQQAIGIDAEYAQAHALLGWSYVSMFNLDSHTPISEFTDQALNAGGKATILDDQDHWGHLVLGLGHARRRRPELAVTHLLKSVDLNPNFALGHAGLGYAFACGGQPERGLQSLELAQRLSPRDPFLALYAPVARYMALFALGRYEETIAICRSVAAMHPHHVGAWRLMTVSLGLLGRLDEAKESLAHTLTLQPDLSSDHVVKDTVFANASDRSRFLLGLQRAGLKA